MIDDLDELEIALVAAEAPVLRDIRDMRDPARLGEAYLKARQVGASVATAVNRKVKNYVDRPFMSANPKHHHSKTPQGGVR